MPIKYTVIPYARIELEKPELFDTITEAIDAKRQLRGMQPENHYEIEEVEVRG